MTLTLKCVQCNIVIHEMLCYIQNKLLEIDECSWLRICTSAFTPDEIALSKNLLLKSLPTDKRKIIRRNKEKEQQDLEYIVSLKKSKDPGLIPTFVARSMEKLP
jgi:hypothetical protein